MAWIRPITTGNRSIFWIREGPAICFLIPRHFRPIGTIGNTKRRFFHGPGFNQWDFALHKNTRVTERMLLEFRAEFFNAFNHAQFADVDGAIDGNMGHVQRALDGRIGQLALKLSF
jgi:hypothetical protein